MSEGSASPISVSVRMFGDLRKYLERGAPEEMSLSLPSGSTVADILSRFGVPAEEEVTPGLNGEQATRETRLSNGDQLLLFGPMEGG